jgi:hypothetical protein
VEGAKPGFTVRNIEALWGHGHWLGVLAEARSYTAAAVLGLTGVAVLAGLRRRAGRVAG